MNRIFLLATFSYINIHSNIFINANTLTITTVKLKKSIKNSQNSKAIKTFNLFEKYYINNW